MALGNMLKWLARDESRDEEKEENYYRVGQRRERPAVKEPEDVAEDEEFRDIRRKPQPAPVAPKDPEAQVRVEPEEDDVPAPIREPEFCRVDVDGLTSAAEAIDLALEGYVVLVNFDSLGVDDLMMVQSYLAGAVHAMRGYINPVDDSNAFISADEFDVTPYLPEDEDEAASSEDLF